MDRLNEHLTDRISGEHERGKAPAGSSDKVKFSSE